MSGKGSAPRPFGVDQDTFGRNWDACFGSRPVAEKRCGGCGEEKPFMAFRKHRTSYRSRCRECEKAANAERWREMPAELKEAHTQRSSAWARANPEKRKEIAARSRAKNPSAVTARSWRNKGYPQPTRPIPDACEMCGGQATGRGNFHLDHCHDTGAFRGWLCSRCNQGLGLLGDELTRVIERVVAYRAQFERQRTFGPKPEPAGEDKEPDQ